MFSLKNHAVSLGTNKLQFWLILLPFFLSLILVAVDLMIFRFLPAKLPLFYSLPWGDEQLANHSQFLIIPATICLITLINLTIFWQLHPSQSFFKKILLLQPLIVTLILTITFIKIILDFV